MALTYNFDTFIFWAEGERQFERFAEEVVTSVRKRVEGAKRMSGEELRIDPAEAEAQVEPGEAMLLDVAAPHVWPQMHGEIAGAVRIDPREIEVRHGSYPGASR